MASAVLVKGSRGTRGLSSERAQCQAGCQSPTTPPGCTGEETGQGCALLIRVRSSACLKPWSYNGLGTPPHQLSPPG